MPHSKLTDKGQTTVPTVVRPQSNTAGLFGSLKPTKPYPGLKKEKEAVRRAVAAQAAKAGHK